MILPLFSVCLLNILCGVAIGLRLGESKRRAAWHSGYKNGRREALVEVIACEERAAKTGRISEVGGVEPTKLEEKPEKTSGAVWQVVTPPTFVADDDFVAGDVPTPFSSLDLAEACRKIASMGIGMDDVARAVKLEQTRDLYNRGGRLAWSNEAKNLNAAKHLLSVAHRDLLKYSRQREAAYAAVSLAEVHLKLGDLKEACRVAKEALVDGLLPQDVEVSRRASRVVQEVDMRRIGPWKCR